PPPPLRRRAAGGRAPRAGCSRSRAPPQARAVPAVSPGPSGPGWKGPPRSRGRGWSSAPCRPPAGSKRRPAGRARARPPRAWSRGPASRWASWRSRQLEPEGAPPAGLALDADRPVVLLQDRLADRQPQPGAGTVPAGGVDLAELVEDTVDLGRGDARPLVVDLEADA